MTRAGLIESVLGATGYKSLRSGLSGRALSSLLLNVLATVLLLLATLVLTRFSDPIDLGRFATVLALVAVLGIPAIAGFDRLLIRVTAAETAAGHFAIVAGLIRRSRDITLFWSSAIAIAFAAGLVLLSSEPRDHIPLLLGLITLPLAALSRLRQAALFGLQRVVAGQLPESLVRPGLFLALAVAMAAYGATLTAASMVAIHLLSTGVAFAAGSFLLARYLPPDVRQGQREYATLDWLRQSVPLTALAGASTLMVHVPIIVLDALRGPESAAIFAVSTRVSSIIPFGLMAANVALGPTIARLWAQGDRQRLQRVVTLSARLVLLLSLPLAAVLVAAGREALSLFGPAYVVGDRVLVILALGQLFNVATGSVGVLLLMTGYHARAAVAQLVVSIGMVPATLILVAALGLEGAAASAAGSLVVLNVLWWLSARRALGFGGTAFGHIGQPTG